MKEINYKDMKFNPFNLIGGEIYQETIDQSYPQGDYHTMYVGKIEKVLVRDDEYLKFDTNMDFKNKIVIVTGGAQGIGRCIVKCEI